MPKPATPATPHARDLKPSSLADIASTATEGDALYLQLERAGYSRLPRELGERLALRDLAVQSEGPGWLRIVKRVTRAHQMPQGDACQVARCGGRIRAGLGGGACTRCRTKP